MLRKIGISLGILVALTLTTRLHSQISSLQLDDKELNGVCWLCKSLTKEVIQKEIGMTDEQKQKIRLLNQECDEKLNKLTKEFNQEYEEKLRKSIEAANQTSDRIAELEKQKKLYEQKADQIIIKSNKKVREILSPSQLSRVIQIEIQSSGIHAVEWPSVSEALKLSDEQKKIIRREIEESWKEVPNPEKEMSKAFQELSYEDMKAVSTKSSEVRGEALKEATEKAYREIEKQYSDAVQAAKMEATEKVLKILTSEQRDQFAKLQGKKFDCSKLDDQMLRRIPANE